MYEKQILLLYISMRSKLYLLNIENIIFFIFTEDRSPYIGSLIIILYIDEKQIVLIFIFL